MQFQIHRLRQENFKHKNKSDKYLANQIKQNKEKATISTIQDSAGKSTNSPQEINEIFRTFYANLWSSEKEPKQEVINSFLNSIDLPTHWTHPLQKRQFSTALKLLPNNIAPDPDGFPAELYRYFRFFFSPLFIKAITEIKQNSRFPTRMNTATKSFLSKPNKHPTLSSNSHLISLISVDIKILSKL